MAESRRGAVLLIGNDCRTMEQHKHAETAMHFEVEEAEHEDSSQGNLFSSILSRWLMSNSFYRSYPRSWQLAATHS